MRINEILMEAKLSLSDLNKRDNWKVLQQKIQNGESFKLGVSGDEGEVVITPSEDLLQALEKRDFNNTPFMRGKSIVLPTNRGGILLSGLYKDSSFGGISGGKQTSERQESGLIEAINAAVKSNGGPITLVTTDADIKDVSGAAKVQDTNEYGKEPYADIKIIAGGKTLLISAKGSRAPSIAGGGLEGLYKIDPAIIGDALNASLEFYKSKYSELEGKPIGHGKIPEVYSKIDHKYLDLILRGNKAMGGPIDYIYIGPMDVQSEYNNGILKVNGALTHIDEYANKVDDIFLRIRRRSQNQVLDFDRTDSKGYPSIFYAPGDGHRRIVVYPKKSVPNNAKPYTDNLYVRQESA